MEYETSSGKKHIVQVLCAILALVLLFGLVLYFYYKVEAVEVIGSGRYSEEEIKEMVLQGPAAENCLLATRFLSRENVLDVPFVDSFRVSMLDHSTICISVKEKKAVGCFPYLDSYIYFDRNGTFIEGERSRDDTIPFFSGIRVKNLVQNQKLDLKGGSVLNTAVVLATMFQKNADLPDDIRFDLNGQINLYYDEIVVNLGQDQNLEDKMTRVMAILPKIQGQKGILHAETVSDNSSAITFEIEFTDGQWHGGYDKNGEYTGDGEYDEEGRYAGPPPHTKESEEEKEAIMAYLDANQDGYNDFTGDPIGEYDYLDISYLDEDGDGLNDFSGTPMYGVEPEEDLEEGEEGEDQEGEKEESEESDENDENSWEEDEETWNEDEDWSENDQEDAYYDDSEDY